MSQANSSLADGAMVQVSQSQLSQDAPLITDEAFGLSFSDTAAKVTTQQPDPVLASLANVRAARSESELCQCLWPTDLFDGFKNETEIYETVKAKIRSLVADTRTHREIAVDNSWVLQLTTSIPFAAAINAISLRNGWHAETYAANLDNNLVWLEHHCARLAASSPPAGWKLPDAPQRNAVDVPTELLPPPEPTAKGKAHSKRSAKKKAQPKKRWRQVHDVDDDVDEHELRPIEVLPGLEEAVVAELAHSSSAGLVNVETFFHNLAARLGVSRNSLQNHEAAIRSFATEALREKKQTVRCNPSRPSRRICIRFLLTRR